MSAYLIAPVYSVALSWYYSVGWSSFAGLIPTGHSMEYAGIFTMSGAAASWVSPLIYSQIYQVTNSQRLALGTLPVWSCLAAFVLVFIDWDKGKQDAQATNTP